MGGRSVVIAIMTASIDRNDIVVKRSVHKWYGIAMAMLVAMVALVVILIIKVFT